MDIGTEFVYEVRETVSDRNCIRITEERYVLIESNGDGLIFDRFKNGEFSEKIFGQEDYANGHIRNDRMRIVDTVRMKTEFGEKELVHRSTDLCGGATETFSENDITYIWIQRQMWSGGVIYEKTSRLIRTSLLPRD